VRHYVARKTQSSDLQNKDFFSRCLLIVKESFDNAGTWLPKIPLSSFLIEKRKTLCHATDSNSDGLDTWGSLDRESAAMTTRPNFRLAAPQKNQRTPTAKWQRPNATLLLNCTFSAFETDSAHRPWRSEPKEESAASQELATHAGREHH